MAKTANTPAKKNTKKRARPHCAHVFERGVRTCGAFTYGMSMLMGDLIAGRVTASIGNAICNAGGKMLNAINLNERYGKPTKNGRKELRLISHELS